MSAINYALTYMAWGAFALIACRLLSWARRRQRSRFASELIAATRPSHPFTLRKLLMDLGTWALALLIWPIAVWIVVGDLIAAARRGDIPYREPDPQARFYAKGHLIERVTVEQAEAREQVMDPLGRVPPLPFGHLNAGWQRFLSRQPSDAAQLWAFHRKTDRKERWSFDRANGIGRGYCWVLDGQISSEIRVEG